MSYVSRSLGYISSLQPSKVSLFQGAEVELVAPLAITIS